MAKNSVIYFSILHIVGIILTNIGIISSQVAVVLITLNIAFWWISNRVPMGVASLLPVALFPLYGVMNGKVTAAFYMNNILMIFIGGFLVASSMQKWNLHKRIALTILAKVGGSPKKVLWTFILISAFLSMWISNTATTIMMVSIAMALIINIEESSLDREKVSAFTIALLLGIAYAANVGGWRQLLELQQI